MRIPRRPFSNRELTVCGLISPYYVPPGSVFLNVGMRNPHKPESRWWIDIAKLNNMQTVVVEAFEPNVKAIRDSGCVDKVIHGNVLEIEQLITDRVALALWWHGPEHLLKADAYKALVSLDRVSNMTIAGCPFGSHPQGPVHGNPFEEHKSTWSDGDFEALGWRTIPVDDAGKKQPAGHITAWTH